MAGRAARAGADVIQFRDKHRSTRELVHLARQVKEAVGGTGVLFIVNDRVDVALAVGADGVHLGQDDMPLEFARRLLGSDRVIGVSVDTVEQARRAEAEGADYVSLGPVFRTGTKEDAGPVVGIAGVGSVRKAIRVPLVAVGGIDSRTAAGVIAAGADGVAVVSAVASAEDIEAAVAALRAAIARGKSLRRVGRNDTTGSGQRRHLDAGDG